MAIAKKLPTRTAEAEEDARPRDVGRRGGSGSGLLPPAVHRAGPPVHPLAMMDPLGPPPPKRVKVSHFDALSRPFPTSPIKVPPSTPSSAVREPRKSASATARKLSGRSPPSQNPYSTSRGLRHFSMKVCEKVEEKGTTTYNEVADELVRELRQAEEALARAAIARGESPTKDAKGKKRKAAGGKDKSKNHDDKNIRRRVYDALNVLMAMDIITKDKKEITWRGLPGSRAREDAEGPDNTRDGMSRRQRVRQLQEEVERRREDVRRKQECLQELMTQNVCFQNLLGRNHARALDEQRAAQVSPASPKSDEENSQSSSEVKDLKDEKIPLPFLVVNTDSRAVVQCEMCPKRTNVSFDFSLPFEINDDNEILKRLGLNFASREALQRSLPPDLFHYCNGNGLLNGVARR
ncbi:hypothetical protein ACHAXT_001288 [Thalassiosira profunda]